MIVSWNWLQDYLTVDASPADVVQRLAMAGLNHESSEQIGDDWALDLEITSNRADCLGHIGIAREIAVLYATQLRIPEARPQESAQSAEKLVRVDVECPDLCPRYTARALRGVKVGPSPDWLVSRLRTLGVKSVNNVVDVTNYVLFESGQPLHAFDLAKLNDRRIVVRRAEPGEQLVAIDHKPYALTPEMCVIADGSRAVALGGIMGGYETEVSGGTTDLLIEAAAFQPLAIRNAARRLRLHSPSSYRFERGVDLEAVEWASRRCCELILQVAGGELLAGVCDVRRAPVERPVLKLRYAQLPRVLGIEVPADEVARILNALGAETVRVTGESIEVRAPSWRRDLTREADLIEEVARIYGYEKIPEDVAVPMIPSHRSDRDRLLAQVRGVMSAGGLDEAMTISAVPPAWSECFSPWTSEAPLQCSVPVLKGADVLRRSIVPSLLAARATNESLGNSDIELFETARVYLPEGDRLPHEPVMLAVSSGQDFLGAKGLVEALLQQVHCTASLAVEPYSHDFFEAERGARLALNEEPFGVLGEVSAAGRQQFSLRGRATVAELNLDVLLRHVELVPQYRPLATFPAITQDLNMIVDEQLPWSELKRVVIAAAGELLETVTYRETYRNVQADGPGKKRQLFSITLRNASGTLTTEEANEVREQVVNAVSRQLSGRLLAS